MSFRIDNRGKILRLIMGVNIMIDNKGEILGLIMRVGLITGVELIMRGELIMG